VTLEVLTGAAMLDPDEVHGNRGDPETAIL
jgi:hypothetical protein